MCCEDEGLFYLAQDRVQLRALVIIKRTFGLLKGQKLHDSVRLLPSKAELSATESGCSIAVKFDVAQKPSTCIQEVHFWFLQLSVGVFGPGISVTNFFMRILFTQGNAII